MCARGIVASYSATRPKHALVPENTSSAAIGGEANSARRLVHVLHIRNFGEAGLTRSACRMWDRVIGLATGLPVMFSHVESAVSAMLCCRPCTCRCRSQGWCWRSRTAGRRPFRRKDVVSVRPTGGMVADEDVVAVVAEQAGRRRDRR